MFVDQNKFRAIKKPGQLKKLTWGRLAFVHVRGPE